MIPIICHLEANIHKIQPCSMLPEVVTSTESDGMSIPGLTNKRPKDIIAHQSNKRNNSDH